MAQLQVARLQATSSANRMLRVQNVVASVTVGPPPSAGADQVAIEPAAVVTLTGSGATTGTWTQTAGPAVTLTGSGATVTYVAPLALGPVSATFTYTVGAQSASVNHTVLPATERAVRGGVEVPVTPRLT